MRLFFQRWKSLSNTAVNIIKRYFFSDLIHRTIREQFSQLLKDALLPFVSVGTQFQYINLIEALPDSIHISLNELFLLEVFLVTLNHACQKLDERSGNFPSDEPLDVRFWHPSIVVIPGQTEQRTRCVRVALVRDDHVNISSVCRSHRAISSVRF